ncbi:MAG: NAD(P)-dependent glycerol-3-phosphate dehydrogenase [bacterium]|nr:NAD(P)-dependent glycerol-3-phosphate dehydrogenase [bacterium]
MSIRVGILGAGSWALGLGNLCHLKGHHVTLWEFRPDACRELDETRLAPKLLPGFSIPSELRFSNSLAETVADAELILIVVPSHTMRIVAEQLGQCSFHAPIVSATKGLERITHLRMTEVITSAIPRIQSDCVAALSGPSHAEEVVKGFPTSVVIACPSLDNAHKVQHWLSGPTFRLYSSTDIVGVELGGALKNIVALAAGVSDGLGFGDNTKGLLMTRGLAEITRLGLVMGGDARTFAGLSGLGDLITTCISQHSRNRFVGQELGKGRKIEDILSGMTMVAEGVNATTAALELSKACGVELPIAQTMYDVMYSGKDIKIAARDLMTRALKKED